MRIEAHPQISIAIPCARLLLSVAIGELDVVVADGGLEDARARLGVEALDLVPEALFQLVELAVPGAVTEAVTAQRMRWRSDEMLKTCTNRVVLALEDDYPATGKRAVFVTDLFNPCWLWDKAPVGDARQIALTVGQIPFNFQVGKDIDGIKFAPPATPEGEFEVRAGTCEGPRVAMLPLAPAVGNPGLTRLVGTIAPRGGNETLCIRYTARGVEPIWAIDAVELIP